MAAYPLGDNAFSSDVKDAFLHITIVKYHYYFLQFIWQYRPYQWKALPFWLAMAPRVCNSVTKPILFLYLQKGLCDIIYLNDILILMCSRYAGKMVWTFLCSLLVYLGLYMNVSRCDLHLTQQFSCLGLCWDTVDMPVSLPPEKLIEIQQLALALLHR